MQKYRNFLRSVIKIAVPVALQSMLQSSFGMIDELMVGQLGSDAVAAVEVAGRPTFIYTFVLGAVAAIAGIMVSQYLGMDDDISADRGLSVNLAVSSALAVLSSALCLSMPKTIVGIFTEDARVYGPGAEYLSIIAWTYLPMGISSILAVMIRAMDRATYPMYAGFISAAVNTGLNYLLIFGRLGFPKLGVTGAAIASLVSQLVNLAIILALFFAARRRERKPFRFSLNLGRSGYKQYILMLAPVVINEFLWSLGQNVNTYIYGHIGTDELAAMSMTGPVQGLFIGALSGVSQAAGIIIGKRLGAKEYDKAYEESKKLMVYGFAASLVLSAVTLLLRRPYAGLYEVEPQVRETAASLLLAFAVLAPVKVANMILGGGIVRSGGKTAYIMAIDLTGTWLVGVPLGFLTAFVFKLPIFWVYFILSQEELVRLIITLVVFRRRRWMTSLEKT